MFLPFVSLLLCTSTVHSRCDHVMKFRGVPCNPMLLVYSEVVVAKISGGVNYGIKAPKTSARLLVNHRNSSMRVLNPLYENHPPAKHCGNALRFMNLTHNRLEEHPT